MKYEIILSLLLLLTVQIVSGQKAELFSKENSGLTDNNLLSIAVDQAGNKWIGTTKHGLVKFANGKFENLNKENSEILGDYISPIYSDRKGNVWVSFSKPSDGIARFDGEKWKVFSKEEINSTEISVIGIAEDSEGNIYFGGATGVLKFDGKTWTKVDLPEREITVRAIDVNINGDLAIGHNRGLLIRKDGQWGNLNEENSELRLGTVRGVKYISDNKLIIGYGGGFGDGGFSIVENENWTHFNKTNSNVPDHMVRDIEIDKNEVVWMATNNGVIRMEGNEITPILFREGMFKNVILDIEINDEVIWIATNFGLISIEK